VLARWCKVLLVGGEVRTERRDLCGPLAEETLRRFRITRAFLGADAVHLQGGFMTTDESTARLNELVLRGAGGACVLADAEKFSRDSFVSYARLRDIELVLTDASISDLSVASFREAGATVHVAEPKANVGA
jgi:DeoR family fructose operon transcriptional repressor